MSKDNATALHAACPVTKGIIVSTPTHLFAPTCTPLSRLTHPAPVLCLAVGVVPEREGGPVLLGGRGEGELRARSSANRCIAGYEDRAGPA